MNGRQPPPCGCRGCDRRREERAGRILLAAASISLGLALAAAAVWYALTFGAPHS